MIHKKKIMFVFGTRPEAIKMAPIIKEMEKHADIFKPVVVVTGQHRQMLDQVLKLFRIKPDRDLKVMEEGQSISAVVARVLSGLEGVIPREMPDMIFVQGDTSTTFAASLAAYYHRIPLAHVEAGLRTGDKYRPYPEELNRKLTSVIADLHFAPTRSSVRNLLAEGVKKSSIYLTGNTVIDALSVSAKGEYDLKKLGVDVKGKNRKLILVTTHRRESFGAPLKNICGAVRHIAEKHRDIATVILPVHRNPIVSNTIKEQLSGIEGVRLIEPLEYEPFIHLMKKSYIILTDSGGIQEEAPSLGKPVLVMRDVTERPEAVACGAVKMVGTDKAKIIRETEKLLFDKKAYANMSRAVNPYGDGKASRRMIGVLLRYFGFNDVLPKEFSVEEKKRVKVA